MHSFKLLITIQFSAPNCQYIYSHSFIVYLYEMRLPLIHDRSRHCFLRGPYRFIVIVLVVFTNMIKLQKFN
jgi:hypothetical protein